MLHALWLPQATMLLNEAIFYAEHQNLNCVPEHELCRAQKNKPVNFNVCVFLMLKTFMKFVAKICLTQLPKATMTPMVRNQQ
jgi:hypothetical protein